MSLGHIGLISLEQIDSSVLGGVSYIESWYQGAHPFNHVNYLTHKRNHSTYIKWSLGNLRVKVFIGEP